MSYPEFRLRPSPEAWMNGLILSPPPFFSMTFQPFLLLSLSPPLSNFLTLPFSKNPYVVSFLSLSPFSLPLWLSLSPVFFPPLLSFTPSSLSALTHKSLHSPVPLLNFFPTMPCTHQAPTVSIVREGPVMVFATQTFTHEFFFTQCHPPHPFSFWPLLYLLPSFSFS